MQDDFGIEFPVHVDGLADVVHFLKRAQCQVEPHVETDVVVIFW